MQRQLIVYENRWLVDLIMDKVSREASEVTRTDRLEERIISKVGEYLLTPSGSIKHKAHIHKLIGREIAWAKKKAAKQLSQSFEELGSFDDMGQAIPYDPKDDLAIVDSAKVETKETITLLAQSDRRVEYILTAWTQGYFNDTELSRILADAFKGAATGHLSKIKALRKRCMSALAA